MKYREKCNGMVQQGISLLWYEISRRRVAGGWVFIALAFSPFFAETLGEAH